MTEDQPDHAPSPEGGTALLTASVIGVRPRPSFAQYEYDLVDADGAALGGVDAHAAGGSWLLGDVAEQHWTVTDASGATVFLIHKPRKWGAQHFAVVDGIGAAVGELQQTRSALNYQLELTAADGTSGRIHARHVLDGRHWTIEDGNGNEVGQVTNRFPPMAHLFSQPDTFVVELGNISGQLRELALATGVCLQVIGANR